MPRRLRTASSAAVQYGDLVDFETGSCFGARLDAQTSVVDAQQRALDTMLVNGSYRTAKPPSAASHGTYPVPELRVSRRADRLKQRAGKPSFAEDCCWAGRCPSRSCRCERPNAARYQVNERHREEAKCLVIDYLGRGVARAGYQP